MLLNRADLDAALVYVALLGVAGAILTIVTVPRVHRVAALPVSDFGALAGVSLVCGLLAYLVTAAADAAVVVMLGGTLALAAVRLLLPRLTAAGVISTAQLPLLFDMLDGSLAPWLAQFGIHVSLDVSSLRGQVLKYLNANFEDMFGSLMSSLKLGGSVALTVIGSAVLIPVALFYLLLDWARLVRTVMDLVPPRTRPAVDSFTAEADMVLGQYLRGQLLVMLTMAVFYTTGLALFGLDLALPIGVFTGLAMFVPYVGFGIGLVLATLAGLLQFASVKGLVMVAVVYGIGQVIEGLYFTPRFVGERIGLHPLAVIFALLAAGQLFG
ncbi:MAG: AI-2E family transporter, partial [Haliea sp.]